MTAQPAVSRIVFCDFDGTITTHDTFVAMIRQFTPDLTAQLLPELYALRLSLRQGVRQLMASIPSDRYPEILEFARQQPMRPGFQEFLNFLQAHQVPIVIVSGGLQDMVETVLGHLQQQVLAIHAMQIDTSGEYLQVSSAYESDRELVAKAVVMQDYPATQTIAIGDSVTDLNIALKASLTFAREPLSQYLAERQHPFIPWQDFADIQHYLSRCWLNHE